MAKSSSIQYLARRFRPNATKPSTLWRAFSILGSVILVVILGCIAASGLKSTLMPSTSGSLRHVRPAFPKDYPEARRMTTTDKYFGVSVPDPYRWLENGDSNEVKSWITAEDHLARDYLDALPVRAKLKERYRTLFHSENISVPVRAGDRLFYMKRKPTDERSILYWRSAVGAADEEHPIIDPNQSYSTDNLALGDTVPSPDGRFIAYTMHPNGEDEGVLLVKDVTSGTTFENEAIEGARYASPSWMPDDSGFAYTWSPEPSNTGTEEPTGNALVKFHKIGTQPKNDIILYSSVEASNLPTATIAQDGKWIFLNQQDGWNNNDILYQPLSGVPLSGVAQRWTPLALGNPSLNFLQYCNNTLFVLTNDGAPHYRIVKIDLRNPKRADWKEIVPESSTDILQSMQLVGDRVVVNELENVRAKIHVYTLEGNLARNIDLPGIGSVTRIVGDTTHDEFYYDFSSFIQPLEVIQGNINNAKQKIWSHLLIPVDPRPYVVEQKFCVSNDGTNIPLFIVHRRDIVLDGRTPFLLHGYGGFGLNQLPVFSSGLYPWLEAGGGYALINLRGGSELGEEWHREGMLLKKQNVFDDCISGAEYLINHGYTKPERLALRGGSNGGLLVGAVLTQRPDLFRAMICESPLLDMIRYPIFASGETWTPEYGSPSNSKQFKALYAYSPYHHVKQGTAYPSILFCTAENDDRVDPMHARKMVAALQWATSCAHPILLRIESRSGHHGGKDITKTIDHASDLWGFLMNELGPFPKEME